MGGESASHTEARRHRETSRGGKWRDGDEKFELGGGFNPTMVRCIDKGRGEAMDATSASPPRRQSVGERAKGGDPPAR